MYVGEYILGAKTMQVTKFYPLIATSQPSKSADFYMQFFDFEIVFAADWVIHLRMSKHPAYELMLLDSQHASLPEAQRVSAQGLVLSFEVEDVDALYAKLVDEAQLPVVHGLRDEAWGQRHFMTHDPSGVLIDVIQPIPPSEEFVDQYLAEV
jgi:uncharacterized glyoxalase superfamily protein PhnB